MEDRNCTSAERTGKRNTIVAGAAAQVAACGADSNQKDDVIVHRRMYG